ncbi:MAG: hypothetical protein ACLPN5_16040 [Roseiarcus sp.]
MRQVVSHRGNIGLRRIECKVFIGVPALLRANVTFLPQANRGPDMPVEKYCKPDNGLHVPFRRLSVQPSLSCIADMQLLQAKAAIFALSRRVGDDRR